MGTRLDQQTDTRALRGPSRAGSTTATARIFRHIQNLGLDTPDLMDFVLSNKSSNPYAIFGSAMYPDLKNYKEWVAYSWQIYNSI